MLDTSEFGLSKIASKARIIGLGKNKAIRLIRGGSEEARQQLLRRVALRQPLIRKITELQAKLEGKSLSAIRDAVNARLKSRGGRMGGTVGKGAKGTRSYIDVDLMREKGNMDQSLRNVIHHESFHKDIPVLGNSELGAHFWGGLNQTKKRSENVAQAFKDAFVHLPKTRPARFVTELAALGGTGYGTYKAGKLGLDAVKDKKDV